MDGVPDGQDARRLLAAVGEAERAARQRLADALHDGPLQALLAARQDAEEAVEGDTELLGVLPGRLEGVVAELRALVAAGHEDALDAAGLEAALSRIAAEAGRRGRFAVVVEVDPAAGGVHDDLVRNVARELVHNAARHADARTVELRVTLADDELAVTVRDDGVGFDRARAAAREAAGHVGLGRIGRTAEQLGGTLAISAREGGGTAVTVRLPVGPLTAQRLADTQLREERRWAAALVTTIQDGLLVLREGRIVQVNDAFCTLVGWERDDLLGLGFPWPFWPADDPDPLAAVATDDESYSATHRLVRADGRTVLVLAAAARIPEGLDGPGGVLVTVKDLTERVREEQQARLQAELRTTIETARRLTAILSAVRAGRDSLFAELHATLVEHLGWQDVVVNLAEVDGGWRVDWTSSADLDDALLGEVYDPAAFDALLHPRFLRAGAWFVPEEAEVHVDGAEHVPDIPEPTGADGWRTGDALFVPMRDEEGTMIGLLSVDRPASGRRPSDTELEVLGLVAGHAALAFGLVG